ncbi:hypothetical protein C0992_000468 [Termitomyces sp. T32_za158]|nr:hypothetical protein C0992_000468 [Termitomyces sp. T32_za158]
MVEVPRGGPTVVGAMVTPVSTPCSRPDKRKCKAVLESEVPRRVRRRLSPLPPTFEGGPSGSNVFSPGSGRLLPSITVHQGPSEILRAEQWEAQDQEIEQLWARIAQEQVVGLAGIPAFTAPSEQDVEELAQGLRQLDELEVRWHEWLLREVTAARLEVLSWACEHRLLVDGMSSGILYVEEELSGQEVTPGLTRGVGRLSRLMGAHRHRTFVEAGSWMEAFVDGLQMPPSAEEMMQAAWDLLESEFGPGGGQRELQEGGSGGA